jgi:hypothetical protein
VTIAFIFWLIMLLTLLFSLWWGWPRTPEARYPFGSTLLVWLLFALIGWQVFGSPLKG